MLEVKSYKPYKSARGEKMVEASVLAPLYWWNDFRRVMNGYGNTYVCDYRVNRIIKNGFSTEDFSLEYLRCVNPCYIEEIDNIIGLMNAAIENYRKSGDKYYLLQVQGLLPSSYNEKRQVYIKYDDARKKSKSRASLRNKSLREWDNLSEWLESIKDSDFNKEL